MWRTTAYPLKNVKHYFISIHVLRVEDDAVPRPLILPPCPFQSTSSVWRTTRTHHQHNRTNDHFNPRPPCGGRHGSGTVQGLQLYFNPRPPCGGRHLKHYTAQLRRIISIHVLRVEDDSPSKRRVCTVPYFNPRPPCGGRPANADLVKPAN